MAHIDAGEPSAEAVLDETIASRLDLWRMAVGILRHDFGQEFSPFDVHKLIAYLKEEEADDE